MLQLTDLLEPGRVLAKHKASNKQRLLEQCAALLAQGTEALAPALIETALAARERLSSTGLGNGVALPHGRVPGDFKPMAAFLQLDPPVEFGAADGQPVDLVLAFIVPGHFTDQHLSLLAQIAELFSTPALTQALRAARDPAAVYACLTREDCV